MEAVVYKSQEEKQSARQRMIAVKEVVEQQMRQRMANMAW